MYLNYKYYISILIIKYLLIIYILQSYFYISNSIIINNENINKWKCGLITNHNHNNLILKIDNSSFKNNVVKNNGGSLLVIYLKN